MVRVHSGLPFLIFLLHISTACDLLRAVVFAALILLFPRTFRLISAAAPEAHSASSRVRVIASRYLSLTATATLA